MKSIGLASALVAAAGWGYLRHIQLPPGPSRLHWGDTCFGHRGCRFIDGVPENTIPAFQYCMERGAKGIEVDIRLTKDDQLVVFHDAFTAPFLTGDKVRVDEMELSELRRRTYIDDPTKSVQVPTLEETILFCQENYLKILIELKELRRPGLCNEKLRDLFMKYSDFLYENSVVISFSPLSLYNLRVRDTRIAVGILHSNAVLNALVTTKVDTYPKILEFGTPFWDHILNTIQSRISPWVLGASVIGPKLTLYSEQYKRKWHSRRIAVYLWGYANPTECPDSHKCEGVFVAADDRFSEFLREIPLTDFHM